MNKRKTLLKSVSKCLLWILWICLGIYVICVGFGIDNQYAVASKEGYNNNRQTIDLPINTASSCSNFCGPQSICAITSEQCSTDIDCYGCTPPITSAPPTTLNAVSYNDAGKLTSETTPTFSVLTSDIGTHAFQIKGEKNTLPPKYNHGVNTWRRTFDKEQQLYETRYNPQFGIIKSLPSYPPGRHTLTGEFNDNGPLAANAFL